MCEKIPDPCTASYKVKHAHWPGNVTTHIDIGHIRLLVVWPQPLRHHCHWDIMYHCALDTGHCGLEGRGGEGRGGEGRGGEGRGGEGREGRGGEWSGGRVGEGKEGERRGGGDRRRTD